MTALFTRRFEVRTRATPAEVRGWLERRLATANPDRYAGLVTESGFRLRRPPTNPRNLPPEVVGTIEAEPDGARVRVEIPPPWLMTRLWLPLAGASLAVVWPLAILERARSGTGRFLVGAIIYTLVAAALGFALDWETRREARLARALVRGLGEPGPPARTMG
jgi:hypothetical protein